MDLSPSKWDNWLFIIPTAEKARRNTTQSYGNDHGTWTLEEDMKICLTTKWLLETNHITTWKIITCISIKYEV